MRKNFGAKPILYPQPVLIIATYDENGKPDAMNAAWGGTADEDRLFLCLSAGHKTTKNLLARKAFTVSVGTEQELIPCDYVGVVSANDVEDKFRKTGWHTEKSAFVDAPLIEELPLAFECELESYDEETGMLLGKVKNVCADERILSDKGKIDPEKLSPHHLRPREQRLPAPRRKGGQCLPRRASTQITQFKRKTRAPHTRAPFSCGKRRAPTRARRACFYPLYRFDVDEVGIAALCRWGCRP